MNIEATAGIPVLNKYKGCCQEIDFTVQHSGIVIDDPFSETTAAIYQNGLWDLGIEGLQPNMVNGDELIFDYQEENIFPGGNEFRFFDTKNTRIPTYYVQRGREGLRPRQVLDLRLGLQHVIDAPGRGHSGWLARRAGGANLRRLTPHLRGRCRAAYTADKSSPG